MIKEWLDFVATSAGGAVAFVCLFEGVRLLRSQGRRRAPIVMVAFGSIYCLLFGVGFSLFAHHMIKETRTTFERTYIGNSAIENAKKLPDPKVREEVTQWNARMAFYDSGKLVEYIEMSGQPKRFAPTEKDIQDRELRVVTQSRLKDAEADKLQTGIGWLVWMLVAGSAGFVFGSRSREHG